MCQKNGEWKEPRTIQKPIS